MASFSVYLPPRINIGAAWAGEEPRPGPCVRLTFRALPTGQSILRTAGPTPRPGSLKPPFICRREREGGRRGGERCGGKRAQPTPRVVRNRTRPHQPLWAQWARRKNRPGTSRVCSQRPGAAPGQALAGSARLHTRDLGWERGSPRASSAPRSAGHPPSPLLSPSSAGPEPPQASAGL